MRPAQRIRKYVELPRDVASPQEDILLMTEKKHGCTVPSELFCDQKLVQGQQIQDWAKTPAALRDDKKSTEKFNGSSYCTPGPKEIYLLVQHILCLPGKGCLFLLLKCMIV